MNKQNRSGEWDAPAPRLERNGAHTSPPPDWQAEAERLKENYQTALAAWTAEIELRKAAERKLAEARKERVLFLRVASAANIVLAENNARNAQELGEALNELRAALGEGKKGGGA